ncbi:hypothetical protein [Celeribacter halophilus]|uniref:hypothetical protein n=1 Tax=Celeribacter halophilus TaxID=576117 RepID=UPI003A9575C3
MTPDFNKSSTSALFETFGFGSLATLLLIFHYREEAIDYFVSTDAVAEIPSPISFLLASFILFLLHAMGRATIYIGDVFSSKLKHKLDDSINLRIKCIRHANPRVWDTYKETLDRIRFGNGLVGTSVLAIFVSINELLTAYSQATNAEIFIYWIVLMISFAFFLITRQLPLLAKQEITILLSSLDIIEFDTTVATQ